jgi:hypothetical protein
MNELKKTTIDHNDMHVIYEELDVLSLLLEDGKYEGVTVMTDYFAENLIVDEAKFSKLFNKLLGDLISHSHNKEAIIDQLPSQFRFNDAFKKKFVNILPVSESEILRIIRE